MTTKTASAIRTEIAPKLKRLRKFQLQPRKGRGPLTAVVYLAEVYLIAKLSKQTGGMLATAAVELWLKENPIKGAEVPRSTSIEGLIIGATCAEDKRVRSRWARAVNAIANEHGYVLGRLEFDAVLAGLGGIVGAAKKIRTPRKIKSGLWKVTKKKTLASDDW